MCLHMAGVSEYNCPPPRTSVEPQKTAPQDWLITISELTTAPILSMHSRLPYKALPLQLYCLSALPCNLWGLSGPGLTGKAIPGMDARETFKQLANKRDTIEHEIELCSSRLEAFGVGMTGSLVDKEVSTGCSALTPIALE